MSASPHPWFPPGTLELASVRGAAGAGIESWSGRWFARKPARLRRLRAAGATAPLPGDGHALDRGGMKLRATALGGDLLAAMALGLDDAEARPTAADRALLTPFVDEMLGDLLNTLQEIASSEPFGTPVATVELDDGSGRALCTIQLDGASVTALVRAALPPKRSDTPGLSSRAETLASVRIPLELRFGRGEVPLATLRELEPGDILVLDRPISRGPDIALPGAAQGFAQVALKAGADRTEIQFTQKIG